ncbi:MAG: hypothetical protein HKN56_06950, partial [Gammaproteobacteria bacterium]|nr:hypothetical protein [Gammaproteobacteria bacterium]
EQLRESFETTGEPEPFLIVWLIGWTIGGAFAAFTLLRNFIGTERLSINGGEITIRNEVFGIGNNRRYAVHEVSNLRIVNRTGATTAPDSPVDMTNVGGLSQASIAFDHGDATVMFGSGLSTTEAELFVDKALRRYSTLGRTDT